MLSKLNRMSVFTRKSLLSFQQTMATVLYLPAVHLKQNQPRKLINEKIVQGLKVFRSKSMAPLKNMKFWTLVGNPLKQIPAKFTSPASGPQPMGLSILGFHWLLNFTWWYRNKKLLNIYQAISKGIKNQMGMMGLRIFIVEPIFLISSGEMSSVQGEEISPIVGCQYRL